MARMQMDGPLELGLYTLSDHLPNPYTGERVSAEERIQEIIQLAVAAEEAGLDYFGVGESHQEYFVGQAHTVLLGAIAQATKSIRIGSASTIISTLDPVRVYEDFASLDLISEGRVELVAGRASRVGLFDLLGYDLADYAELYDEKLGLLRQINEEAAVSWQGQFRPSLEDAVILPKPFQDRLPIWRAVGGGPQSAAQAGRDGMPMFMAQLGGPVQTFAQTVKVYRQSAEEAGQEPADLPVAVAGWLYAADTVEEAVKESYPYFDAGMQKTNGSSFPKRGFAHAMSSDSVMVVGPPEEMVDRILNQYDQYGMQRYTAQIDFGGVPFEKQLETVDMLGAKVLPELKKYTNK